MYGGICSQHHHSFPTSEGDLSPLTISLTLHYAQMDGRTWRSISSSPKRTCQSSTKTQFDAFTIPHLPPPTTAAAAWLDHGNGLFALEGTQFPSHSTYSRRRAWMGVEFQPWNDFKSQQKTTPRRRKGWNDSHRYSPHRWREHACFSRREGAECLPAPAAGVSLSTSYSGSTGPLARR